MNTVTYEIILHDQVRLIQGHKAGSAFKSQVNIIHHINRLQKKQNMTISTDREKAFNKIQHTLEITTTKKSN